MQRNLGYLMGTVLSMMIGALFVSSPAAWAAEDDENSLAAVAEQLRLDNPELSETEALELAGLASSEVSREGLNPAGAAAGQEKEGILLHRSTDLGAPGISTGPQMTPEEQALSGRVWDRAQELSAQGLNPQDIDKALKGEFKQEFEKFQPDAGFNPEGHEAGLKDDARLRDLYERGTPGLVEHAGGLEQRGGGAEMERYREFMGRDAAQGQHELPTVERSYETSTVEHSYEAPTVERSYEAPTVERSYEAPTVERSYEAPTVERSYEAHTAEQQPREMEYTPPQG